MAINDDLVKNVLDHADIVHVISSYGLSLIKRGNNYVALCPFHNDKHPSMYVNPEKRIFKCFSCGMGGNAISFVSQYEHVSFQEAIKKVADLSGYTDPRLSRLAKEEEKEDEETLSFRHAIEDLGKYYRYSLDIDEGKDAIAYLNQRGLDENIRERYSIGYSPLDGIKTIQYLQAKGHSLHAISGIGVASQLGANMHDLNAGRVMFSLKDKDGRLIGFSARRFRSEEGPKYINTSETKLFHKSEVLYGYHLAKETARKDGYLYVLEGFMDVIALYKAGITSAVALMGTALTKEHIALFRALGVEIRMCLDGDKAGQDGMMKAATFLQKEGIPARFVHHSNDLRDPDDILQKEGKDGLYAWVNTLLDPMEFQLAYFRDFGGLNTLEKRQKAVQYFLPYLASLPSGIAREDALVTLAQATGFEASAIRQLLSTKREEKREQEKEFSAPFVRGKSREEIFSLPRRERKLANIEREILTYMVLNREAIDWYQRYIGAFVIPIYQDLANYLLEYSSRHQDSVDLALLTSTIEEGEKARGKSEKEKQTLLKLLLELGEEHSYPPYGDEELTVLKSRHDQERKQFFDGAKVRNAVAAEPISVSTSILEKYATEKRSSWQKRKKKKEEDFE